MHSNRFFCRNARKLQWLIIGITFALSQTTYAKNSTNLVFKHILPDQLESIGYLTHIEQDSQGFLWFAGNGGLARYDGYSVNIYKHKEGEPGSLSDSYVNHLLVTRDNNLWVATHSGLNLYDPNSDTFKHYKHPSDSAQGLSVNEIYALLEDRDGRLWLGTRGGLIQFYRDSQEFSRFYYDPYPPGEGDSVVYDLAEDHDGMIWVANHTGGLTRFDPATNTFKHYRHSPEDETSLSNNDVREVYVDRQNNVWVGTYGGGLNLLPPNRQSFKRFPYDLSNKSDIVWDILEDQKGQIWVGDGGAINLLDMETETFERFFYREGDLSGPGNHVINDIFEDEAGDIWVGYFPSGVDMVDPQASVFHNYVFNPADPNSVSDGGILATLEDKLGNLWIGAGYGLSYFDRKNQQFTNFRHDPKNPNSMGGDTILSLAQDADGILWMGIWSAGLNRYDPATGVFTSYLPEAGNPDSLMGKEPWALLVDSQNTLWVATELGVNRFNRDTNTFTRFLPHPTQMDGDNTLYTRALLEDSNQNLWVGSIRGLYKLDKKTGEFQRFRHRSGDDESLSTDYVKSLFEDSKGNLWVGTHGGGLNLMEVHSGRFTSFHSQDGLPDEVVSGIIEDDQGQIWMSTHKGLSRFNPATGKFRNYDKRNGLPGNLFNRNTPTKLQSGELLFGSSKGLTVFDPSALWDNTYVPPIVITDFQIFNRPVALGPDSPQNKAPTKLEAIELTHKQSVFSFGFAALNYRSPEENQYAYKLEGFDSDWQYVGSKRTATYNLDGGDYVFKVKGSNNEGLWNETPTTVKIKVLPPIYRTWWAYSIYALGLAGLLYLILRFNLKRQAYERERTLNQRLKELDRLKDEFLANTSHELRTPLNGIIGLSESLLDGAVGEVSEPVRRYLEMISFSGKRLANLVNDILDFSKLKNHNLKLNLQPVNLHKFVQTMVDMTQPLVGSKELTLVNAVSEGLPPIMADENRLQQVFYNLIGNAIKFTDVGSVTISATLDRNHVVLDVVDTGIGIPATQLDKIFESFEQLDGTTQRKYSGTGLGLAITRKLVELHKGKVSVTSKEGIGSRFQILLPKNPDLSDQE